MLAGSCSGLEFINHYWIAKVRSEVLFKIPCCLQSVSSVCTVFPLCVFAINIIVWAVHVDLLSVFIVGALFADFCNTAENGGWVVAFGAGRG